MQRTVFFISDGTGITAETLGHSLLTQFEGVEFKQVRIPFVDNEEKARAAVRQIEQAAERDGERAIVFNTVVNPELCSLLATSRGLVLDLFAAFLAPLEAELNTKRTPKVGRAHGMSGEKNYDARIHAMNYALAHDDGVAPEYDEADVVLVGVSRSGKTPTCLYLALHYGVSAGNYPLTEEDLEKMRLPDSLRPWRGKLFGLSIDPERLHQIRQARRPNSRYADIRQCRREVAEAEALFEKEGVRWLSTTHTSIEEIASKMLQLLGIERHFY